MEKLREQWQAAQHSVPDLAATVRLLKSWARSRGFSDQPDALNGFLLTMLAVHLVEGGNLVRQQRPTQHAIRIIYWHVCNNQPSFARNIADVVLCKG